SGGPPLTARGVPGMAGGLGAWGWGGPIRDFGPLRAIRADLLRSLDMQDRAFGWPVEMVVKAAVVGARILEVPVSHQPRVAGHSKVSGTVLGTVRAGYAFLSVALRAARHRS